MEIMRDITVKQLNLALANKPPRAKYISVTIDRETIRGVIALGSIMWFEYHCNESHDSPDAPAWYRSHQQVRVLRVLGEPPAFTTFKERAEGGMQITYTVEFADGLRWDVFEDELLTAKAQFERPDPPRPRERLSKINPKRGRK